MCERQCTAPCIPEKDTRAPTALPPTPNTGRVNRLRTTSKLQGSRSPQDRGPQRCPPPGGWGTGLQGDTEPMASSRPAPSKEKGDQHSPPSAGLTPLQPRIPQRAGDPLPCSSPRAGGPRSRPPQQPGSADPRGPTALTATQLHAAAGPGSFESSSSAAAGQHWPSVLQSERGAGPRGCQSESRKGCGC